MASPKLCWLDIRDLGPDPAVVEEALHAGIHGIVADDPAAFTDVPSSVDRVLVLRDGSVPDDLGATDIAIVGGPLSPQQRATWEALHPKVTFGRWVDIVDAESLEVACTAAADERWSVLNFKDPTKIPLEIVLAAAARGTGSIVTTAVDAEEAEIVYGVLEHGSDGVVMPAHAVGDATALVRAAAGRRGHLGLVELTVTGVTHVGMGERACVDTCTYFDQDEGILVGSHSKGMVLCVSETHPLPYMPTRPFRVNAGAIHSYTLAGAERTRYLSELRSGSEVLAVGVDGRTRVVTVGRVKIETRPLLSVDAVGPEGQPVNLILQDDWHVRVLGPGGVVLNSTELTAGDVLLGHLPTEDRHVGYPIDEFCREQ